MVRYGLSAVAVLALVAPAWAQPALSYSPGAFVDPVLVPPTGYWPTPYTGSFDPRNSFPPAPVPSNAAPVTPAPGGAAGTGTPAPVPDPVEFMFDPYNAVDPAQRPRRANVPPECWVTADWLFWHVRDAPVPALIVGSNPATPYYGVPQPGNFYPLVGPTRDLPTLNGVRLTVGKWFDPDGELGAEVSGFLFARVGTADVFQDSPSRTLGVLAYGTDGTVALYQYSYPGLISGSLAVATTSQLYSGEATFLHRWYNSEHVTVDGMLGYRYLQSDESLGLYGRTTGGADRFDGAVLPPGVTISTTDTFRARTEFHGAEFGTRLEARYSVFTFGVFTKGGLGANIETLRIDGQTQASGFGLTKTAAGGVRALPSDIGTTVHSTFAGMSEFGTELGVKVTDHLSVKVGYDLLYWTKVLRPGNAIDSVANLAQVPIGASYNPAAFGPRPIPMYRTSDLLANGLVLGLSVEW